MENPQQGQRSLSNDQIRVTETAKSATDILRSAKPYMDASFEVMQRPGDAASQSVEVPANVFHDLVVVLAAEMKRADAFARRPRAGDPGDGDWNPFNGIDFEFD